MTDTRVPTQVTEDYWIRAYNPSVNPREIPDSGAYTGKWLLYIPVSGIDDSWTTIRDSTESGTLGIEAKTATMKGNPYAQSNAVKLICVYTKDYRDIDDVRRVLIRLRELGFKALLSYKTDAATYEGRYGNATTLYTSQADSIQFGLTSEPKAKRKML